MKPILLFFFIGVLLASCNRKIFVDKDDIIYHQTGYVILFQNSLYFLKEGNNNLKVETLFKKLSNNTVSLQGVSEQQLYAINENSLAFQIELKDITNPEISHIDTLKVIYMEIKALPYSSILENYESKPFCTELFYNLKPMQLCNGPFYNSIYYLFPVDEVLSEKYYQSLINFQMTH
jgi:hypothetical protein